MGCTNSRQKTDDEGQKSSRSGADSEDEIFSTKPMVKSLNDQQNLTRKTIDFASGLTTANTNASTTSSTLLDNRLQQTSI